MLSERPITKSEVIVTVRVIGGLPMLDGGEADDKIIGILAQDMIWSHVEDLDELPQALVQRLRHYFTTYKMMPGDTTQQVSIDHIYDRASPRKSSLPRWLTMTTNSAVHDRTANANELALAPAGT